jgi:hypothetical protein
MTAARPGVLFCYGGNDIKTWTYFVHTNRATATVVSANPGGMGRKENHEDKVQSQANQNQ